MLQGNITRFRENLLKTFHVILQTDKQTYGWLDAGELHYFRGGGNDKSVGVLVCLMF